MDRCERPAWGNVTGPASAVAAGAFVASEKLCRFDSCHSKILSNLRFFHETFCAVSFFRFVYVVFFVMFCRCLYAFSVFDCMSVR